MSALDMRESWATIDSAIVKLTAERDAATGGEWGYSDDTSTESGFTANVTVNGWDVARCSGGDADPGERDRAAISRANAKLIETTHAAIDPVLTIMSGEMNFCRLNDYSPSSRVLELAQAINANK